MVLAPERAGRPATEPTPSPAGSAPPPSPRHPLRRRVLTAIAVVLLFLTGAAGFLVAIAGLTLPSLDGLGAVAGNVRIVDRHGAVIAQIGGTGHLHTAVPLTQIAPVMQAAVIAAEDRDFYLEGPVSVSAIGRALITDILNGHAVEGASTITQQLARDAFLPNDTSALRKLREALLADEINTRYTKQQILTMYLNTIYFGHGAYGVDEAAQAYFGVHAAQLTLAQAALIAGLPQAPSRDDPYADPAAAFARMHYVLGQMVADTITPAPAALAVDPLVGVGTPGESAPQLVAARAAHQHALLASLHDTLDSALGDPAPHFVAYVRDELDQLFQNDPQALAGGVTVTTSLDLSIQQRAQQAVTGGVARIGRNANNGALLMLDSHSGDIIAMVGSAGYGNAAIAGEFNVVTAPRRPGSSFKPYVYEEAFKDGALTPSSILDDTAAESRRLGGVTDWDGSFMGPMPAGEALLLSRNVPTEQAMERAGTTNVINFAHSLGITTPLADNASTAIGTSAVRMIDHAAAYAAFANGGTTVQPRAIVRVTDAAGRVLYAAPQGGGTQVMTPPQAYQVTDILRHYNTQWHDGIHRDIASKSGTTDNYIDAWFMAYTPDWVVATWAGHTSGSNPAEVGMNVVYGNDVGQDIAAPFINGLGASSAFSAPPGFGQGFTGGGTAPAPAPAPRGGGKGGKKHGHG